MRLTGRAAAAALSFAAFGLAGCSPRAEPAAEAPAEPAASAASEPAADAHAGMHPEMAASDAADDANTAETPDGFTFHTYPNKVEAVHLPSAGSGSWMPVPSDIALVSVGAGADETMPDGSVHHVVRVSTLASGNATVKFERRETADPAAAPAETRTINFMIH